MQNQYTKEKDNDTPFNKDRGIDLNASLKEGEEYVKNAAANAEQKIKQGREQLKNVASQVDHQLRENPWPIVAGVAIGCVLLGFIMGTAKKS